MTIQPDDLMPISQAARRLGIAPRMVFRAIDHGLIESVAIDRLVYVKKSSIRGLELTESEILELLRKKVERQEAMSLKANPNKEMSSHEHSTARP